jgi:hypothetical protein
MNTFVHKPPVNQSKVIPNSPTTRQSAGSRPETVAQRQLQEMADNSPQVRQLKALQEMANHRPTEKNNGVAQRVIHYTNNQATLQPMVNAIRAQNAGVAALYASPTVTVNISLVQGGDLHGDTTQVIPGNNDTFINNLRAGRGTINIIVNNHGNDVQLQQSLLHELVIHAVPIRNNLERARALFTSGAVVNAILAERRLDPDLTENEALLDVLGASGMSLADFQTAEDTDHLDEAAWAALANTARLIAAALNAIDPTKASNILYAAIDDALDHLPGNSQLSTYLRNTYYADSSEDDGNASD